MRTLLNYIYIIAFLVMLPIIAVAQIYVRNEGYGDKDGTSWANAIDGNAYYQIDAASNFDYYSIILRSARNSDLRYLCKKSSSGFEFKTSNPSPAVFELRPAGKGLNNLDTYYIYYGNQRLYASRNVSGYDFDLGTGDGESYKWYIVKSGQTWQFYVRGKTWGTGSATNIYLIENTRHLPDSGIDPDESKWEVMIYGLQYAIKEASESSPKKTVYLGAGTYQKIYPKNGVSVYGGVTGDVASVSDLLQTREGIAVAANQTNIGTVATYDTYTSGTQTILDGINVTGSVSINDGGTKNITLRNSIINGATTVYGGLLYNSLVENLLTVQKTRNVYIANVTYTDGGFDGDMADYGVFFKNKKKSSQSSYYDYQLDETEVDASIGPLPPAFESFGAINYDTDRDLLGNPRKMGSTVDRGAFEAWCVRDGTVIAEYDASRKDRPWNYYPVANTNVFLMDNSTFVLGDNLPTGYELTPRKLLLKEGAVLYGQGYNVNVSDISVERTIPKDGLIMSLPFAHTYTQGTAYSYSGTDRSAFNYDIKNANSGCWKQKAAPNANKADECEGVFFVPDITGWSSSEKDAGQKVLRFSSTGTDIYKESGASKSVTLTQYDDYTSTDNAADFTSPENMGWNCIGIPYLVNDYKPYRGTDGGDYMMQIPHTLWLYYDNTDSYQHVSSWDDSDWNLAANETAKLWFGEGFFTQTAAVSASESLKFYHPVYEAPTPDPSPAKAMANTRHYVASQKEDMDLDTEQSVILNINRNMLTISNLNGDEGIDIYTLEGMQKVKTESKKGSYSCTLRPGMYVVKVNDLVRKVMVR